MSPSGLKQRSTGVSRFTRRVLEAVAIVTLALLLLYVARTVAQVLLLAFAGVLLAVLLRGMAEAISARSPLSPRWSLVVVVLGLLAAMGLAALFLAPRLMSQADQLREQLPQTLEQVRSRIGGYEWGQRLLTLPQTPGGVAPGTAAEGLVSRATGIFSSTLEALASLVLVVALGLYLAADPEPYIKGLVSLVPQRRRARAREILDELGTTLWRWLMGQLIAMAAVGALTVVGLILVGAPLGFLAGFLTGLFEFIPLIGPLIGIAPAVLLALTQGTTMLLKVLAVYAVVQLAESYIIQPLVQFEAVDIPPALLLATQVAMGILFGFLGLFLAVPLLAITIVLVKTLYIEDVLGESITLPGDDDDDQDDARGPSGGSGLRRSANPASS